jgi:hypothetical protein
VALGVGVITLAWLGPWAWAVAGGAVPPLVGVSLAYAPLMVGAAVLGAGRARADACALSADDAQRS